MNPRFLLGRKGVAIVAMICLLLSVSLTFGSKVESVLGTDDGSFGLVEGQQNTEKRRTFARSNYQWPFATGPYYGDVAPQDRWSAGTMISPVGSFNLGSGMLELPSELTAVNKLATQPLQYFVVQLQPTAAQDGSLAALKQAVESFGGAHVDSMPVATHVFRLSAEGLAQAQGMAGVLTVQPFHPAFKLHPGIGRAPLIDPVNAISEVYKLDVTLFAGENAEAVASAIAELGANVTQIQSDMIKVEAHRSLLSGIASIDAVRMVYEDLPVWTMGEETTAAMQIGSYDSAIKDSNVPFHTAGVTGEGQVLMVLDSGISVDAADLSETSASAGTIGPSHRKVIRYESTGQFGGGGDTLGCDSLVQGGVTHGHTVSATALGNATQVDTGTYGSPYEAQDANGNPWRLDGVAYQARVVAFDAHVTPNLQNCSDSGVDVLNPGNLYTDNACSTGDCSTAVNADGSLPKGYKDGARDSNFSWGSSSNTYTANSADIDEFIFDTKDAMVFVSAGNAGDDADSDGFPDEDTLGTPATTKNGLAIGASGNVAGLGTGTFDEEDRAFFSSMGPTPAGRIAPQLMAPGTDANNMGLDSEFHCASTSNAQTDPVGCTTRQGSSGTSFSSPAAAGAALLVRDYFEDGFYPDGTDENPSNAGDSVPTISGALVKAVLVASADFMSSGNLTVPYRANNEQGWGRIQLDNALPIENWNEGAIGLIVTDGDTAGGAGGLGLSGNISGGTDSTTFNVCDPAGEVRVALTWNELSGDAIRNNLDLELVSPGGAIYYGNYFTDDNNRDRALAGAGEDCPSYDGTTGTLSQGQWSIETCANSVRDSTNNIEMVALSPDPNGDGDDVDSQIETGDWTLNVIAASLTDASQTYAVAVAGGVCNGSSVRFVQNEYTCNGLPEIVVNETDEVDDPAGGLTPAEISSRVSVDVVDVGADGVLGTGDDSVVDTESGLTFVQDASGALKFTASNLIMTDGTAPDPGNGAFDVQDGQVLVVTYADEASGVADPDQERKNSSLVDCSLNVQFGSLVFGQFGRDSGVLIEGGCELNARGNFEFGFPDRYMDADESLGMRIAFNLGETEDAEDVQATLTCVIPDADSPVDCAPGSNDCADPNRDNNAPCGSELTILDPTKTLGRISAGSAISANFSIMMGADADITGEPTVEFRLALSSATSGKSAEGVIISRQKLDVDEDSLFYSTDFPTGGTEELDWDGNEVLENPTTNLGEFELDYRFENRTWSNLTAGGRNAALSAPWDFDADKEGFTQGLGSISDNVSDNIALWGEDQNFNDALDIGEDSDPANGSLDQGWGTGGGCGWQTSSGATGGVWHTGNIGNDGAGTCLAAGNSGQACQSYETITGITGAASVFDLLLTETVEKVNFCDGTPGGPNCDADGNDLYDVQILDWSMNLAVDLPDSLSLFTWEFDIDADSDDVQSLITDGSILNLMVGAYGAVSGGSNPQLTDGYPMFAPLAEAGGADMGDTENGSVGNNRSGKNSCFFEGGAVSDENYNSACVDDVTGEVIGCFSEPFDNDIDENSAGGTDEFVTDAGPLRNFDMTAFNGPDLRFTTLEDIYGDAGNTFQGALGFLVAEGTPDTAPAAGFGVSVDDMVLRWKEFTQIADTTDCAGTGSCAVIELDTTNFFQGNALVNVSVTDHTPASANDCDGNGTLGDPGDDNDCNNNGTPDISIKMTSEAEPDGEFVVIDEDGTGFYSGSIAISTAYDVPGTLFLERVGTDNPTVNALYLDSDYDAGTVGDQACPNDADSANWGRVETSTTVFVPTGLVTVVNWNLTDNGDNDGSADTNETVDMTLDISNKTGLDLEGVVVRIATNSPNIDCILTPVVFVGDLLAESTTTTGAFSFRVANVNRSSINEDFSAAFDVTISSTIFDALSVPQEVILDLDLDISGGGTVTSYTEGFESAGSTGSFSKVSLDSGIASNALSDGRRCQYNDPDNPDSNSFNEASCYLGFAGASAIFNTNDWNQWSVANADGGRAYLGSGSLHYGAASVSGSASDPASLTTKFSQLDTVQMTNPVNLAYVGNGGVPELSFKHQVSFTDFRLVNAPVGESADRGVVAVQIDGQTEWTKIYPYQNVYDVQGTDNYTNCTFDPIDDGNTEDDFFDPTDPDARLGPSSTCFPEFSWAFQGDVDYRNPFSETALGRGTDGPALAGSLGNGSWLETRFNLNRYQGRSIRVRFLFSSLKLEDVPDVQAAFANTDDPRDDGWWIDDVQISPTLTTPATVVVDNNANGGLPACGAFCNTLTSDLVADPASLNAPGQVVELDASGSSADRCLDGVLQFQFWVDGNSNGVLGDPEDTLLRDWTDNALYVDAPAVDTDYGVAVRCSSESSGCMAESTTFVPVACPSTGTLGGNFPETVIAQGNKTDFNWSSTLSVDAIQGDLNALRTNGGFGAAVNTCLLDGVSASGLSDGTTPTSGNGLYYLVKEAGGGACNATPSYSSGGTGEDPGRDSEIAADADSCP